jgi:hypothetical protein
MKMRVIAVSILVILSVSFPINKAVDVELKVTKHHAKPLIQTKATMEQKRANKLMAREFASAGWGWDKRERQCIHKLFTKESRFDHLAKNQQGSSAYGIGQVLKEKSSDPAIQLLRAYKYIEHRYGTPCRAWNHHLRRNWY